MNNSLLTILCCLLFSVGNTLAQTTSYVISPKTINVTWDYTEDLDMRAYISSNSILNQDIEYTVIALDIPNQWKDNVISQFCDIQSCYDFRWFKLGDKKEMKLPANLKAGIMKVDFLLPLDTAIKVEPGSAEAALGFNVKGEPMSDTLKFLVNKSGTGIKESIQHSSITISQNSQESVQLSSETGISEVNIYDITGTLREAHQCGDARIAIISMNQFSHGVYLFRVKDNTGKESSSMIIK